MDRHELAEHVAIADHELRRLAAVLQVLRDEADGHEREELVAVADLARPLDDRRGADAAVAPEPHVLADHGVRAHNGARADRGAGMHGGACVDGHALARPAARRAPRAFTREPHQQTRFAHDVVPEVRTRLGAREPRSPRPHGHLEPQAIAGNNGQPELRAIDAAQVRTTVTVRG